MTGQAPHIGVLAVQGGFHAHCELLRELGARVDEIRTAEQVEGLDGLVLPGGESTTITMGIESAGLGDAIRHHHASGGPVLATCAGMILAGREHLGLVDITTRRNAFGRQLASFEADIEVQGIDGEPFRAIFIRAPWAEAIGEDVEVLAAWLEHPVAVRQADVVACSFHPELTDDPRIHELFLNSVKRQQG